MRRVPDDWESGFVEPWMRGDRWLKYQLAIRRMQAVFGFAAVTCIVAATCLAIYFAQTIFAHALKEAIAAVFTGVLSILSAVLGFVFTRMKDREMAAQQRMRELELAGVQRLRELEKMEVQKQMDLDAAARAKKQENYELIIETLAPYIRKEQGADDKFATAYVRTWIVGSSNVLEAVQRFLDSPNHKMLDAVLTAMREDMSLKMPEQRQLGHAANFSSRGLFTKDVQIRDGL